MIIEKYDIRLRSLNEQDLEMVRVARNSDYIRNRMRLRSIISEDQQQQWYRSLDPARDVYMIIEYDGKARGIVNVKNIDYSMDSSESGLFFWDTGVLQSFIPVITSWLAAESGYLLLGGQQTQIHVLKSNATAIDFNINQGYTVVSDDGEVVLMQQTKKSFSAVTLKSRLSFLQSTLSTSQLMLHFGDHEQDDFREKNLMNYLKLIEVTPARQSGRTFWFDVDF